MKNHLCSIIETRPLWADAHLLTLAAPDLARSIRPGQFALARDPSTLDPYLRCTLWLFGLDDARVSFLINASDPLAQHARAGDTLDVLAPLGHAITFEPGAQHILLIGEGTRTTRLVAIAHEQVKLGREVVVVIMSSSPVADGGGLEMGVENFPSHLLASEIELRSETTFDAELIAWADGVVASGMDAERFYRGMVDAIRAVRYRIEPRFARVMLDLPMPCGTGICYACAVSTAHGVKLACVDGPALDLVEWKPGG